MPVQAAAVSAREQALEDLLNSPRGLRWPPHASEGLRLPLRTLPLLRSRLRLLLLRGREIAEDLWVADFDEALLVALDRLEHGTWAVVFKDSTSLKPDLVVLSQEVLDRGIGEVGSINIPPFIWPTVVPEEFSSIASRRLQGIRPFLGDGLRMARGPVRDGVLQPCDPS